MPKRSLPIPEVVTVYCADWCRDCDRTRRYLDATGTAYDWIDLTADAAGFRRLKEAGFDAIPIVITPSGQVLVEPTDDELAVVIGTAA